MKQTVFVCIAMLAFMHSAAYAQMFASRNALVRIVPDSANVGESLASTAFAAECMRGYGSYKGDQAWNVKMIGHSELYRWAPTSYVGALLAMELTCNPYNDLGFNPRAAVWEQMLTVAIQSFSLSAFHRCKHDIDNSDPFDSDEPTTESIKKRVLISAGLGAQYTRSTTFSASALDWMIRAEGFLYNADYRFPRNSVGKSWEDMIASTSAAMRFTQLFTSNMGIYCRGLATGMFFGGKSAGAEFGGRAEMGCLLMGRQNRLDVFLSVEHLFDEIAQTIPAQTTVFSIGIRTSGNIFF